jgi:hypothetical protein
MAVTRTPTKVLAGVAVAALAAARVAAVVNYRRGQKPDPETRAHLMRWTPDSMSSKNRTATPQRAASGASSIACSEIRGSRSGAYGAQHASTSIAIQGISKQQPQVRAKRPRSCHRIRKPLLYPLSYEGDGP